MIYQNAMEFKGIYVIMTSRFTETDVSGRLDCRWRNEAYWYYDVSPQSAMIPEVADL